MTIYNCNATCTVRLQSHPAINLRPDQNSRIQTKHGAGLNSLRHPSTLIAPGFPQYSRLLEVAFRKTNPMQAASRGGGVSAFTKGCTSLFMAGPHGPLPRWLQDGWFDFSFYTINLFYKNPARQ